jgi:hypothetical protein
VANRDAQYAPRSERARPAGRTIWPFARKPVVDDETAAWHVDNFAWLIRQFGGAAGLAKSNLVLPMPGYFVTEGEKGHPFALRIFDQIKTYWAWRIGRPIWPQTIIRWRTMRASRSQ